MRAPNQIRVFFNQFQASNIADKLNFAAAKMIHRQVRYRVLFMTSYMEDGPGIVFEEDWHTYNNLILATVGSSFLFLLGEILT